MLDAVKRAAEWKSYLRSNPIGITQNLLKKLFPERVKFFPLEKGAWRFEGRVSYGKLLEGLPPKIPRTRRSLSWSST